jgi:hypothetical protein
VQESVLADGDADKDRELGPEFGAVVDETVRWARVEGEEMGYR